VINSSRGSSLAVAVACYLGRFHVMLDTLYLVKCTCYEVFYYAVLSFLSLISILSPVSVFEQVHISKKMAVDAKEATLVWNINIESDHFKNSM
jgi:hypothetical protein